MFFYYTPFAVMRFLLLRFIDRVGISNDRFGELRWSRLCGYILLVIDLALSGAVLMILHQNKGYEYHGILIYIMAAYIFYITTLAFIVGVLGIAAVSLAYPLYNHVTEKEREKIAPEIIRHTDELMK